MSRTQFRHADDGVHRRADFVAHVGQEKALGAAGRFGGLLGLRQLPVGPVQLGRALADADFQLFLRLEQHLFGPLALGHVVDQPGEHASAADGNLADGEVHGERRAVLAPADHLAADADDLALAGPQVIGQVGVVPLVIRRGHEHLHVGADHLGRRVAEQAHRGRVDRFDDPVVVDRNDAVHRGLENRPMAGFAVPQGRLGPFAIGDVARNGRGPVDPSRRVVKRRDRHGNIDPRAVLPHADGLIMRNPLPLGEPLENPGQLGRMIGRHENRNGLADDLLGGVAVEFLRPVIPTENGPLQRLGDNGVLAGFHNGCQAPDSFLIMLALGDVQHRGLGERARLRGIRNRKALELHGLGCDALECEPYLAGRFDPLHGAFSHVVQKGRDVFVGHIFAEGIADQRIAIGTQQLGARQVDLLDETVFVEGHVAHRGGIVEIDVAVAVGLQPPLLLLQLVVLPFQFQLAVRMIRSKGVKVAHRRSPGRVVAAGPQELSRPGPGILLATAGIGLALAATPALRRRESFVHRRFPSPRPSPGGRGDSMASHGWIMRGGTRCARPTLPP